MVKLILIAVILSGCAVRQPIPIPPPPPAPVPEIPYAKARLSGTRVIREKCIRCHGANNPPNGLNLAEAFKGGKRGPACIPYKPHESPIWQAVTGNNGLARMPPAGPLAEDEIEAVRIWIDHGCMTSSMGNQEP